MAERRTTVMVVDDHPIWRDAVARDLADDGFDVVATADGVASAKRRAARKTPPACPSSAAPASFSTGCWKRSGWSARRCG